MKPEHLTVLVSRFCVIIEVAAIPLTGQMRFA